MYNYLLRRLEFNVADKRPLNYNQIQFLKKYNLLELYNESEHIGYELTKMIVNSLVDEAVEKNIYKIEVSVESFYRDETYKSESVYEFLKYNNKVKKVEITGYNNGFVHADIDVEYKTVDNPNKKIETIEDDDCIYSIDKQKLIKFKNNAEKDSYYIQPNTKIIGKNCFSNNATLKQIHIPKSVEIIEYMAFSNMNNLEEIIFEEGSLLKEIQFDVFSQTKNIKNFYIGEHVSDIDFSSFNNLNKITISEKNRFYSLVDNVIFNKDKTKIIRYLDQESITNYNIPKDVKIIGEDSFIFNKYLKSIHISKNVEVIEKSAFNMNDGLENIIFEENSNLKSIDDSAFRSSLVLEEITLPKSLISLGRGALAQCRNLKKVNFEKNSKLVVIGEESFDRADNLKYIVIPKSVELLEVRSFNFMQELRAVIFEPGSNLKHIEKGVFTDCTKLRLVQIPKTIKSIGRGAFYGTQVVSLLVPTGIYSNDWSRDWNHKMFRPYYNKDFNDELFIEDNIIYSFDGQNKKEIKKIE